MIYITHRLGEVMNCADRVVVLRDGRMVGELGREALSHAAMIRLMIGRDLKSLYIPPREPPRAGGCTLAGVVTTAFPDRRIELVGAPRRDPRAGRAGRLRPHVARAHRVRHRQAARRRNPARRHGWSRSRSPRDAIRQGIYLVPEDRKRAGLVLDMSIRENITLADLLHHARLLLIDRGSEAKVARAQAASLSIKAPNIETQAITLSGGNQQKVVLAKWLSMQPRVVIFDEPTRGIDVGAKTEIYALMRGLADRGVAIIMISSDMEEVIGVSDRIAVMHEGRVSGLLEREQFTEYNVLRLAIGQTLEPTENAA